MESDSENVDAEYEVTSNKWLARIVLLVYTRTTDREFLSWHSRNESN